MGALVLVHVGEACCECGSTANTMDAALCLGKALGGARETIRGVVHQMLVSEESRGYIMSPDHAEMMRAADFERVKATPLSHGVFRIEIIPL